MDEIDRVLEAWRKSPDLHDLLSKPARPDDIARAEARLGRPLAAQLRRVYEFGNGMAPMQGNLVVDPLDGDDLSLVSSGDRLREWGWPIPEELLVFGGNGGDDLFGVWLTEIAPDDPPVVVVGAIFEPNSFALTGTTLGRFLLAWSAYYLLLLDAESEAVDALGLPDDLRQLDDSGSLAPYFSWADPGLPDPNPDPYERGSTPLQIEQLIAKLRG